MHGDQVSNVPSVRDSPAALRLPAAWTQHRHQLKRCFLHAGAPWRQADSVGVSESVPWPVRFAVPTDTVRSFRQSRRCGQNHRRSSIIHSEAVPSGARASGIVFAGGWWFLYILLFRYIRGQDLPAVGKQRKTTPPGGTQPHYSRPKITFGRSIKVQKSENVLQVIWQI